MPKESRPIKPAVAAIVLAAGSSTRMGQPKALLPLGDRPVVRRVIDFLEQSEVISHIIVVTGHGADAVCAAVDDSPVEFAHNRRSTAGGMLSSIQTGIAALADRFDAAVLALVDQPLVDCSTVAALVDSWIITGSRVTHPTFNGKRGHPILLDMIGASEILALGEDETLKTYISNVTDQSIALEVTDPGILFDIDTPGDYERACELWGSRERSQLCRIEKQLQTAS